MKTKIRSLMAFLLLSAASLTILFGSPNTQPNDNPQTEPEVTVPSIVSTSSDNGGMRTLADTVLPSVRYGSQIDLNQPSVTLEQLDVRSVTLNAPNQIGVNRSVAVSPNTRAQKFVNPDGSQIIVLIIKSSGASGIGVHFRKFALADDEELYVYGAAADSIVFGPYTNKGPWGSGEFWSGTVDGDTVVIEFYTRPDENGKGFEIFEISHIFTELDWRLRSDQPDVLNCELDASCYGDIEKNAVARILFNNNGPYVCTGTLLNDVAQNFCPYFLTANHCVETQTVAQTVEVYWFYQTTSCYSGILRTWVHSPPGANLLATQNSNDFSLLRLLHNAPGGAYFSGWTPAAQSTGTSVFGLHHPGGSIPPMIDSYLRRADGTITSTNAACLGLVNGYTAGWMSGTTEPGSSGSGLWTSNGYLVGVLSCGPNPPTCNNPYADYSKFANFYPQIQPYIGSLTPSPPVANPATFVASNSFTANWRSACGATGYRLDVSASSSFNSYVTGYQNLNVGNATSRGVTGLNASTTYYYRARAYNGNGTSGNSNVVNVTTLSPTGPPVAITDPATLIASFSATLNGSVDPHGLSTTVYFEYGTTNSYGHSTANQTKTGNTYENVSANISGLTANTTYHFRIVATNSGGTRYGSDRTFTTLTATGPPVVTTNPATNMTISSATLNGSLDPHGLTTTFHFQYGTTTSYGHTTAPQTQTGNTFRNVSANIGGLTAHTTYHFRIVASNSHGTRYGSDRTFTTTTPSTCNIAGTWVGTVSGTFFTGNCSWTGTASISAMITQNGTTISGSADYDGIPCFNTSTCGIYDFANTTGSVTGSTVNCPLVSASYNGTVISGACSGQAISVTVTLMLNGNTLSGTSNGLTVTLTRQP